MRCFYLFITCLWALSGSATAQTPAADVKRPKLVVGVVVDQMRWDYLYRFLPHYGPGGFKRLMQEGYSYEQTYFPFTPSLTAAGHASIFTGAFPSMHGIVGNSWYERATERRMYCTADSTVHPRGGSNAGGRMSPVHLMANTVGDELRLFTQGKSRVYGVAIKDRGAILPAGRSGNGAFWFDDSTGNMISSSYYYRELPEWVKQFNQQKLTDEYLKTAWTPLEHSIHISSSAQNEKHKHPLISGKPARFPYQVQPNPKDGYKKFRYLPAANTYTVQFAEWLLQHEQLGKQGNTDMLCISFSATDYAGHEFGPQSPEVADMYLRLDRDLASLLQYLDQHAGAGEYLVFLTADHAAPYSPSYMADQNLSAGAVNFYGMDREVDQFLQKKFGVPGLLVDYYGFQFFLNNQKIDSLKIPREVVYDTLIQYLLNNPEVVHAIPLKQLHKAVLPAMYRDRIAAGYYQRRSGDIQVILKPSYVDYKPQGTEHGSLFNYDTRVPLLWYGWRVPAGKSFRRAHVTDIAPTLSQMLYIDTPGAAAGEVLTEIMPQ